MKTALVILTYNDGELSSKLAVKVKDYKAFDHIILVDNKSTDDSAGLLSEAAGQAPDRISVLRAPENGGYAKGNNLGIRYAINNFGAELIFVANPDTFFTDQTANAMIVEMERHPEYGLTAPLVNQGYNAWNLPTFAGVLESLFLIIFNLHKKEIRSRLLASRRTICPVGVVEGSFFAISAKAYEMIGGMDERTFLYGEEIMLSYRLMQKDLKVGILPRQRYDHLHSATIKKQYQNSKARAFHHFHDSFRIYNKYYLHTGLLQNLIFEGCYILAYLERVIYDHIKN